MATRAHGYQVFGELGTEPAITYLPKVDLDAELTEDEHAAAPQAPVIWMTVNG
jgi:hypothetical protein